MKLIACLVSIALLLLGCNAATLSDMSAIKPQGELPIKVQDRRPAGEKSTDVGSLVITSCNYGLTRFGDDRYSPDPVTYFANQINKRFTAAGADDVVVLKRLAIYVNSQASLRQQNFSMGQGPSGAGLVPTVMWNGSCYAAPATPGGLDIPNENPDGHDALVIYIDADFRGQHYTTRYVEVVTVKGQGLPIFPALDAAIHKAFGPATSAASTAPAATAPGR